MDVKGGREAKGLKQAELARMVGVSQQTIARWERSGATIAAKYWSALAAALGGRPSDFAAQPDKPARIPTRQDEEMVPYGTAELILAARGSSDVRRYPISERERVRLLSQVPSVSMDFSDPGAVRFAEFETMDGRWVIVNLGAVAELALIGDDVEAMPDFPYAAVLEACSKLTGHHERPELPEGVLREAKRWIEYLGGDVPAEEYFQQIRYVMRDGSRRSHYVCDETLEAIDLLFCWGQPIPASCFLDVFPEGYYRATFIPVSAIALIEVPRLALDEWTKRQLEE